MTYTKLLFRLVDSELLNIETLVEKLIHTRSNTNLDTNNKNTVNKILVKLLQMFFEESSESRSSFDKSRVMEQVKLLIELSDSHTDPCPVALAAELKTVFEQVLNV